MEIVEVPAKIFLIGEYLVLEGGDAVLEALRPGYRFESGESIRESLPHPESPAGKLLRESGVGFAAFRLLEGSAPPGFGGSTAELLMAWRQVFGRWPDSAEILGWYRERVPLASGADLSLQLRKRNRSPNAEVPEVYGRMYVLERLSPSKRPTHEDLALVRPAIRVEVLTGLVARFRQLLREPVAGGFRVLGEFADELYRSGRETEDAHRIRRSIEGVEGVEGVKGCGAGLHDQFLMVLRPGVDPVSVGPALERAGVRNTGVLAERVW